MTRKEHLLALIPDIEYDLPLNKLNLILEAMENHTEENHTEKKITEIIGEIPDKDQAVQTGFQKAADEDYESRRVVKDSINDIYYSGWMDCYDWIIKFGK